MLSTPLLSPEKIVLSLLLALSLSASAAPAVVQHDLTVDLDPDRGRIKVVDRIRLPGKSEEAEEIVDFYLSAAFEPVLVDSTAALEPAPASASNALRRYRLRLAEDSNSLTLSYSGRIAQANGVYERGHVGAEGVYLTGSSAWYPLFDDALITFSLLVRAPQGWTVVSQGSDGEAQADSATGSYMWRETRPQTDIVLLGGRFVVYTRRSGDLDARVYLRRPDPDLAERYLQATEHYVDLYQRMLGPYPYDKFALVENFWETGYGMPSLALLGPRVIRFPFILHSSFPHEILHNWWGNGVYLEPYGGNWSEGLTAYLADHLIQEQRGRGADHRRAALQKYASYVDAADDFPLSAFRGKHGEVSQAVGYNKALMFFHMLRLRLGDADFLKGLRLFADRHRFQPAGYDDLRRAFEEASGAELSAEFRQWVEGTGAPLLRLEKVELERDGQNHRIRGVIEQQQPGPPYRLRVPLAIQLEGRAIAVREIIFVESKRGQFDLTLPARPLALHLDPEFDLFRRLLPGELPASLGDLLGAKEALFILPAGETTERREGYERLARALGGEQIRSDALPVPAQKSVWLLGWNNAHLDSFRSAANEEGVLFGADGLRLGAEVYARGAACVVMATRSDKNLNQSIGFIGCDNLNALPGLARKVPHYSKYGFLAFTENEPINVRKEEWPVRDSPMDVVFDPQQASFPPPLLPRSSLSDAPRK